MFACSLAAADLHIVVVFACSVPTGLHVLSQLDSMLCLICKKCLHIMSLMDSMLCHNWTP